MALVVECKSYLFLSEILPSTAFLPSDPKMEDPHLLPNPPDLLRGEVDSSHFWRWRTSLFYRLWESVPSSRPIQLTPGTALFTELYITPPLHIVPLLRPAACKLAYSARSFSLFLFLTLLLFNNGAPELSRILLICLRIIGRMRRLLVP